METETVLVGSKYLMDYVTAVVICFTKKNIKDVIIKARGQHISKAIEISEMSKKIDEHINIGNIITGIVPFRNDEGKDVNVPLIEIPLYKD